MFPFSFPCPFSLLRRRSLGSSRNLSPPRGGGRLRDEPKERLRRRLLAILLRLCPGGGVLPYMGYIGMCGPKGYGFSAVLVIDRVSILADFGHFGHK